MALGELLQGGLASGAPAGSGSVAFPRAAMVFTSTLRLNATPGLGADPKDAQMLANYYKTTSVMPSIALAVNPNNVKFTQPKRFTKKDTRDGSVFFHFTNSKGQNNDILTVSFQGSTGNIDLRGSLGDPNEPSRTKQNKEEREVAQGQVAPSNGVNTGALYKLMAWHNLYALSREPLLLPNGQENVFTILYSSPLFPIEIIMNGFFSAVLEFEETAEKPNSRKYSFEFIVTSTEPSIDEMLSVLNDALAVPPDFNKSVIDTGSTLGIIQSGENAVGVSALDVA